MNDSTQETTHEIESTTKLQMTDMAMGIFMDCIKATLSLQETLLAIYLGGFRHQAYNEKIITIENEEIKEAARDASSDHDDDHKAESGDHAGPVA